MDTSLADIVRRLDPAASRAAAVAELDALFAGGDASQPDGFLRGALLATTTVRPLDALFREWARLYMPWMGKIFDAASATGRNRFATSAAWMLRPFSPQIERGDGWVHGVPFATRIAPGALDPGHATLKIDYDIAGNPAIVRTILDEIVEIADGEYLGKVLLRLRGTFRRVGYFTLTRA